MDKDKNASTLGEDEEEMLGVDLEVQESKKQLSVAEILALRSEKLNEINDKTDASAESVLPSLGNTLKAMTVGNEDVRSSSENGTRTTNTSAASTNTFGKVKAQPPSAKLINTYDGPKPTPPASSMKMNTYERLQPTTVNLVNNPANAQPPTAKIISGYVGGGVTNSALRSNSPAATAKIINTSVEPQTVPVVIPVATTTTTSARGFDRSKPVIPNIPSTSARAQQDFDNASDTYVAPKPVTGTVINPFGKSPSPQRPQPATATVALKAQFGTSIAGNAAGRSQPTTTTNVTSAPIRLTPNTTASNISGSGSTKIGNTNAGSTRTSNYDQPRPSFAKGGDGSIKTATATTPIISGSGIVETHCANGHKFNKFKNLLCPVCGRTQQPNQEPATPSPANFVDGRPSSASVIQLTAAENADEDEDDPSWHGPVVDLGGGMTMGGPAVGLAKILAEQRKMYGE